MPNAAFLSPHQRPYSAAGRANVRAGVAGTVFTWALGATFAACAEVPPPRTPPAQDTAAMTVALYQPDPHAAIGLGGGPTPAAQRPSPAPARPAAGGVHRHHDQSSIPTPIDNPWALGLLAGVVGWMAWMDRRQKRHRR
ncbi:MAG: IPTL-CTERM sorting domain-containing protein [Acidovorax sp.]|uniref:IPTL-CTERM sorting domain-containing protein n=1 Tax=Acidovorax sp. TaxID=1872122 RepID=UPI00391AA3A2